MVLSRVACRVRADRRWRRSRLGAVGYGGQAVCYFTALRLAPAGLAALLLYLHPALVALLAAAFLHERLTVAKLAALVIALTGTTLTVAPAIGGDTLSAARRSSRARVRRGVGDLLRRVHRRCPAIGRRAAALPMSTVVITSAAALFIVAS